MCDDFSKLHEGSLNTHTTTLIPDGVAIFLFHGIIGSASFKVRNYTHKHLTVERFTAVVDALCRAGVPVSMPELVAATIARRPLPPRAFIVTFDDGFENNYSIAAPILERRRVPATFYVTTAFIDQNSSSWIDLIEYAFENTREIHFEWAGDVGGISCGTDSEKREALNRIRAFVKTRPDIDPYRLSREICGRLGISSRPSDEQLDRKMTWTQVRELSQHDLFTVGGHGHTHRILEFLDQEALQREIGQSLQLLRRNVPSPLEHYSYPEGLAHCYSPRVISLLRQSGIRCAPTAEPGINRIGDDLFHLKRTMVI